MNEKLQRFFFLLGVIYLIITAVKGLLSIAAHCISLFYLKKDTKNTIKAMIKKDTNLNEELVEELHKSTMQTAEIFEKRMNDRKLINELIFERNQLTRQKEELEKKVIELQIIANSYKPQ